MIAEGTRHGKSRYVLIQVPDAGRAHVSSRLILESLDPSSMRQDSLLLVCLVCFVVTIKGESLELIGTCL
jgi:hypothetical protein